MSADREQRWFMSRIFLGAFPRGLELLCRRDCWVVEWAHEFISRKRPWHCGEGCSMIATQLP